MTLKPVVPVSALDMDTIRTEYHEERVPGVKAVPLLPRGTKVDRRAWLAARRNGLGASDLGVILGKSSFTSPYALWHAKRDKWDLPSTEDAEWGHRLEQPVADKWQEENPNEYVAKPDPILWGHRDHDWLFCTPDRLVIGEPWQWIPLELKTDEGGPGWGPPGTDEVPYKHWVQVQIQCAIFDAPFGYLARLGRKAKGRKYAAYVIKADADKVAEVIKQGQDFWTSIQEGRPPELDAHPATLLALQRQHSNVDTDEIATVPAELAEAWMKSRKQRAATETECKRLDNLVRAALGNAGSAMDPQGNVFVRRQVGKHSGYSVPPGPVDKLVRTQ